MLAAVAAAPAAAPVLAQRAAVPEVVGRSVLGRPIVARVAGARSARTRVLVVGCIHGDEPAGKAITRRLRSVAPAPGGPRPLSEPESRAIRGLVRRLHPAVTIWYHQHARLVDDSGGDRRVERRYADLVGLPLRRFGNGLPGRITGWQNASFPSATAFVVELAAGALSPSQAARHVAAVLDAAERTRARSIAGLMPGG